MSLLPNELDVIKQQLGYPLTRLGAEPWVTFVALFDKVVQPYLFDNSTTVALAITAVGSQTFAVASNPVAPNNAALLTFNVGTQCVVDLGAAQETVTLTQVSGTAFTAVFALTHLAGFTIWPSGAEWTVRGILARIVTIENSMNLVAPRTAGVAQADETKFFPASKAGSRSASKDMFEALVGQRDQAREDLAAAIGVENLWKVRLRAGGPSRIEAY